MNKIKFCGLCLLPCALLHGRITVKHMQTIFIFNGTRLCFNSSIVKARTRVLYNEYIRCGRIRSLHPMLKPHHGHQQHAWLEDQCGERVYAHLQILGRTIAHNMHGTRV